MASAARREYGPLTRTDFVRYQGASGDFNPIHHDDEFAQSAGYPTVFSVGMLQAGILASYATDWLGAHNVRRFGCSSASRCGRATVVCSGTVIRRYESRRRTVDLELVVTRRLGRRRDQGHRHLRRRVSARGVGAVLRRWRRSSS